MMRSLLLATVAFACVVAACARQEPAVSAATSAPPSSPSAPGAPAPSTSSAASAPGPRAQPAALPTPAPAPDAAAVFAVVKPKLVACYEKGKRTTPAMLDGRLTLHASVDARGKPSCVIPSSDTGLTQEVEDCMSAQLLDTTFTSGQGAPWSAALPIQVRGGVVQLGEPAAGTTGFESIETYRMPDAFEVLESLVPELQACMRGIDRSARLRSVLVGARVATDGRTQCALAASESLPAQVGECAAGVLRGAKFPPPRGGPGLVLVPITLGSK